MAVKVEPPADGRPVIYSHPTCGYCDLLKDELKARGVAYTEINVSKDPALWAEVERLTGGDRITPVLVTPDGEVEIGYNGIGCNYNE